jgi:hypothetical protein
VLLVLGHLVDAVDHAGNVTTELKQERPEDLESRSFFDEHREERQHEAQQDEKDLHCDRSMRSDGIVRALRIRLATVASYIRESRRHAIGETAHPVADRSDHVGCDSPAASRSP